MFVASHNEGHRPRQLNGRARRRILRTSFLLAVATAVLAASAASAQGFIFITDHTCGYNVTKNTFRPTATVERLSHVTKTEVAVTMFLLEGGTGTQLASLGTGPVGGTKNEAVKVPDGSSVTFTPDFETAPGSGEVFEFGDGKAGGAALVPNHEYKIRYRANDFDTFEFTFQTFTCRTVAPPTNTVRPAITGIPKVGHQLTGARGTWSGQEPIEYTERWLRCEATGTNCSPVATGASYTVAFADDKLPLRFEVTATNAGGSTTAVSNLIDVGDSDEDGLLDYWERTGDLNGDGTPDLGDLDLATMGAQRYHKDVFVEIDAMESEKIPQSAIDKVVTAFANAPVKNLDGTTGIALHVDNGQTSEMKPGATWGALSHANTVPEQPVLCCVKANGEFEWTREFDAIKAANFAADRQRVFHYALSIHEWNNARSSGVSRNSPGASFTEGASDFMIALPGGTAQQAAGTFMHELGHNLGLQHGGEDGINEKPNYLSVMNYIFQFSGLRTPSPGLDDYSRYGPTSLGTLDERSLSEEAGFSLKNPALEDFITTYHCPDGSLKGVPLKGSVSLAGAVDWNCDGSLTASPFSANINGDSGFSQFTPFDDWENLHYEGGSVGDAGISTILPSSSEVIEPPVSVLLAAEHVLTGSQGPTSTTYIGPPSVQYSDVAALAGTLLDTSISPGAPVGGEQIGFALGTQTASAGPTDGSGNAATSLAVTQKPGSVTTVNTSFAGNSALLASSDSDSFAITKEDCTLAYSGDVLVAPASNTKLAADLGELDSSLGDLSNKTVTFTVTDASNNAHTFTAATDSNGHAETSQPLGSNVYGVSVSFVGDDYYKSCRTSTDTLVTVQAAGSKVTGGGWISISTGKTNFGFNAIPEAGGLFKGQFQLRSNNGKNRFHGNVVSSLTGTGNTATWSGTGSWNGSPGYRYTISVVDNGSSGAKKRDTISITIKSPTNATVYTTSGSQTLKGGNITVH